MGTVASYRDLLVWQKAVDLVVECYKSAAAFPKFEQYALRSQLQKAAVAVPANIAEGQGRSGTREFLSFLSIAHGSLMEVETHLEVAFRLGYIDEPTRDALFAASGEVGRMLHGLIRSLRNKLNSDDPPPTIP